MFTLEQKVDLVMRYIASGGDAKEELKKAIIDALVEDKTPEERSIENEMAIIDILRKLGMPVHVLGYKYTIHAIRLCVNEPRYGLGITTRLYPEVAKKFGTTPQKVERGIRYAIESTFERCDWRDVEEIFGNTVSVLKGKPVNRQFIVYLANYIRVKEANL